MARQILSQVAIFTAYVVIAFCAVAACAPLHSPIGTFEEAERPGLRIEPVEIDEQGLLIRLHCRQAKVGDELQIWARRNDQSWRRLQAIAVTSELADPLRAGKVEWRAPLGAQADLEFQLRLVGDDQAPQGSPVMGLRWDGWSAPPTVSADANGTDDPHIALSWNPSDGWEARVLKRDVLNEGDYRALFIVAEAAGGKLIDTDILPGHIYSYRIQFVDTVDGIPRLYPYTESTYVAAPE